MPETESKAIRRPPVKVELALPPLYQGKGSYTQTPKEARDVQFALPGSRSKPVEVLQIDSAAVPQPFVDPAVFKKWGGAT
ncbi:hypothetical protein CH063_09644 [Colletotrichum higginsianum]|uniref:Uncharacterized protein n=2 Tax=Colletotrichum higginsianum TaxID=80884 RepID=H1VEE1_COLHI|nr:hypothetical protein CH63R_05818 [Colletotrichum higginsianum IMI 349063]OBR10126.1 hypothetical protein CH63R_05818 [Colletotrichum higginsianum IMI 349063]TID06186.1 hypothetical protein CH35J_001315 [Colletotrichum higginsianum]CCF38594.1 hypothetical protein CH063_09644 [Colletotrichum higginsianum]